MKTTVDQLDENEFDSMTQQEWEQLVTHFVAGNNDLEPTLLTLHTACDLPATLYTVKWDKSGMDSCNPRFSGLENRFVVFFHALSLT